ncbi:hypothetical protein M0802_007243 [Mischocyttarus mexicanus]|nr:hypothetical protein M0802_007243 [Mischocyttarus mexicanus]
MKKLQKEKDKIIKEEEKDRKKENLQQQQQQQQLEIYQNCKIIERMCLLQLAGCNGKRQEKKRKENLA